MTVNRRVVVVTLGWWETRRWRRALKELPRASEELVGYTWDVCDTGKRRARWWLRPNRRALSPTIAIRAERLRRFLSKPPYHPPAATNDPEITLVAARRGCQVVQQFAVDRIVHDADVRLIRRIRHVVLVNPSRLNFLTVLKISAPLAAVGVVPLQVAASTEGGTLLLRTAQVVFGVLAVLIPQLINVFGDQRTRQRLKLRARFGATPLAREYRRTVERGDKLQPGTWPIPTTVLDSRGPVPEDDDNLLQVLSAVTRPAAHPRLYSVDRFALALTVEPTSRAEAPADARDVACRLGRWDVLDDNAARSDRTITFAASTATASAAERAPWVLRYRTVNGLVVADPVHQSNLWPLKDLQEYYDDHKRYEYWFMPRPSPARAEFSVRVYGGFTGKEQRSHTHFRADTYYAHVQERLDLSAYLQRGWVLAARPTAVYVIGELPPMRFDDPTAVRDIDSTDCNCARANRDNQARIPLDVREVRAGVFEWSLEGVRDGGLMEFEYKLVRANSADAPSADHVGTKVMHEQ